MKAYRGVEIELLKVLTSALDSDELSASWPGRFTAHGRLGGPHKWFGRSGEETKISCHCHESNPYFSVVHPLVNSL
jgi:hypothetical protein